MEIEAFNVNVKIIRGRAIVDHDIVKVCNSVSSINSLKCKEKIHQNITLNCTI